MLRIAAGLDDTTVFARLAIARVIFRGKPGLQRLAANAASVHTARLDSDPRAAELAYLRAVGDGGVDYLASGISERLEAIRARHGGDVELMALFKKAVDSYGDAAIDEAAAVFAGPAAEAAIAKVRRS
ncbi:hypothetical protein [Acidovorax sp. SRB_24]|uniref:hypothetical protein n=1 Tax=Acidovorax sp. SRB_24 TaxID=1962700 RepID=UPI00145CBBF7|nr:hypothetical protein [Acidovorax sp. SRB_24]